MTDDTLLPFDLPAVRRKKLTVDFEGGNQSSNGGALLLREAERDVGVTNHMRGTVQMQVTTIGLDIAKNVFQVHGIDAKEKVVVSSHGLRAP